MSKQAEKQSSIPWKRCLLGGVISLAAYTLIQMLAALALHTEVMGMEGLKPAVGLGACLSLFLGAAAVGAGQGRGRAMIAGTVLCLFLAAVISISLAGGARPWAEPAGAYVLLGGLIGAAGAALLRGKRRHRPAGRRRKSR